MIRQVVLMIATVCIFCPVAFAGVSFTKKIGDDFIAVRVETFPDKVTQITLITVDNEIAKADAKVILYENARADWEAKRAVLVSQRAQMVIAGIKKKIVVLPVE